MAGKVIQGSFPGGQPKLATVQPRTAPPSIQAKTMARPPGPPATIFAVRSPGPPAPAFTGRPPAAPSFAGQQGTVQRHGAGGAFAVDAGPLGLVSSGGRALPEAVRGKMEAAFGADFSGVRVHVGPQAERIGAIAFTVGSDIYFAPGRYQPDTIQGQQLLGHELAHVVQQRAGRVRNPLGAGLAVVQDRALEAEADRIGQKAAAHQVVAQLKTAAGAAQPMALAVVQRRGLTKFESERLAAANDRLAELKTYKGSISDALVTRGGFGNLLGYFQDLGWDLEKQEAIKIDAVFGDLADLSRRAATNDKAYREFISKVNFYDKSGGLNKFFNIYKNIEKKLMSTERNNTQQITKMDEIFFSKYLKKPKPPLTVYRGDGRDVTPDSFAHLPFTNIPAGGTPDVTFAGVVEHTHTNTLKNGMVSCTTSKDVAIFFATEEHEYGVVWELKLDNYIHVTDLLKARNFKYRFPGQLEVLYPGAIPASKIVSATLLRKIKGQAQEQSVRKA